MKNLLKELVQASGISGFEDDVHSIMARELKPYVNEITVDNLGNLIAKKQGVKGKPIIMLSAHIDTIGLLVKYVDKKGFIKFAKVGGIVNQTLLGQRVVVHAKSGNYPGVIFSPFEFLPQEKKKEQPEIEEMFIDIGCVNEEDAKQIGVQVGSPISLDRELADLNEDFVVGKAFDDRLGCLTLIEIIKQLDPIDATVYAVGNVQEEIGLRGATVSAFKLNPDLAIIIDTTTAADFPSLDAYGYAKLGVGPAIRIADGSRGSLSDGAFMPARLRDLLIRTAEAEKIPYQIIIPEGGITDASVVQLSREGIIAGSIGIPVRYSHSASEVANIKDIENTVKLLVGSIKNFKLQNL